MDIQVKVLPTPSSIEDGNIYQYIGPTNDTYTNGFFYTCRNRNSSWGWYLINVQDWIEEKAKSIITNYGQLYLKNFETTPESSWTSLFRDVEKQWVAGHRNIFLIWDKVDKTYELCRVITYNVASDTMALVDHNHTIYSVTRSHHLVKEAQSLRISVMPEASEKELGNVYEFTGESDLFDTEYRYICRFKNGVYYWEKLDQYSPIPPTPSSDRYVSIDPNQGLTSTEKTNAKKNIDLDKVGNFKAVSTVANQSLTQTEITNAWKNIKLDQLSSDKVIAMTGYEKPEETDAITEEDTLNEAIGKLEKALESIQPEHTHTSADIISMSGYLKGDDYSGIMTTDNLNQAIGKLENQIDRKSAVSISGTMVSGNTIGTITIDGNPTDIKIKNSVTSVTESSTDNNSGRIHITYANGTTDDIKVHNINNAAFRDVDDEITEDSEKLITSGAVYDALDGAELTDENVTQTPTVDATDTGEFEVLLAGDTSSTEYIGHTKKSNWLKFSPSTKKLLINSKEVSTEDHTHVSPDVTINDYDKTDHTGEIEDGDTLNEALAKLENALDDKAALSHTHAQSNIMMTGYSRGTDSSAVTGSDTLGQAIGKLENRIISGQGSVVSITGILTSGSKIGTITIDGTSTDLNIQGVSSISGGATDGTISVYMHGSTQATEVPVHGLGSAAYKNESYFAQAEHDHISPDITIDDYTTTGISGSIEDDDTLNEALAKLENKVNSKASSTHVHSGADITTGVISQSVLPSATTSVSGIVQLSSATGSTSEDMAATPKAVKIAYELAANHTQSSDTVNIDDDYEKPESYSEIDPGDTLTEAIGKLEKALDGVAPVSHNHSSNDVTSMGSYSKLSDSSPVTGSDTLNQAISKLENQIGNKSTVSITGTLTSGASIGTITIDGTSTILKVNGVSSISESESNGKISVTNMGGTPSDVPIHGLGSAAYTNSTEYAAADHEHVSPNVTIDEYDKTDHTGEIEDGDTLNEALAKLENALAEKSSLNHTHAQSNIMMTGYSRGTDSSAVTGSDTLGQAIGKLENRIISGQGSVVSITGTLTSGTSIGTITIDGTPTTLKVPESVDEKVKQTTVTNSNAYTLLMSESSASTTEKTEGAGKSTKLTFVPSTSELRLKNGDDGYNVRLYGASGGTAYVEIGNSQTSAGSGNTRGALQIYDQSKYYVRMMTNSLTDYQYIDLPNDSGTIALTKNIIDENVTQTPTSSSDTSDIEVILAGNNNNSTYIGGVKKSDYLKFNPSTKKLFVNGNEVSVNGHTHVSPNVTIDDYDSTGVSGNIADGDALNTALAKLENNVNSKASSTHVHSGADITSGTVGASYLPTATTNAQGIVKLSDAIDSTSTELAATANSVKTAYNLASGKSTVSFTQDLTAGTTIGTITIDETPTVLYYTDTKVTQTNTTMNSEYNVLLSYSTDSITNLTEGARKSVKLTFNPYTGLLSAIKFSGDGSNLTSLDASNLSSGTVPNARLTSATTDTAGIVKLSDDIDSTSTELAATANSVKTAYDLASSKSTVSLTRSLTEGTKIGTITIGNSSTDLFCQTNTDENVTQTDTTADGSYRVLFSSTADDTTHTDGVYKSGRLTFNPGTSTLRISNRGYISIDNKGVAGTTTAEGKSYIAIGNNVAAGANGNSYGMLRLFGHGTNYIDLLPPDTLTTDPTLYLPNKDGTLAITDDIPTITQVLTSGTKIATVTLGSTTTALYAPSGGGESTDEKVKQNIVSSSSSTAYPLILAYSASQTAETNTVNKSASLTFTPLTNSLSLLNGSVETGNSAMQTVYDGSGMLTTIQSKELIEITVNGDSSYNSAGITLGNDETSGTTGNGFGFLRMYGTGSNYVELQTQSASGNYIVFLPNDAGTIALTKQISDTKVKQQIITDQNDHNLLFSESPNSTLTFTEGAGKSTGLVYNPAENELKLSTNGTPNITLSSQSSFAYIQIGKYSGGEGEIVLTKSGYGIHLQPETLTKSRDVYIPNKDGTLAITNDIPSISPVLTSGTKIATVTLGSTTTDLYCQDKNVTQTATTTNANYEVLFSYTADNTTRTEGARKASNLKFNPSTGLLSATKFSGDGSTINNLNGAYIASGTVPIARLPEATASAKGIVQLSDAIDSTSTTIAATANAVRKAYDLANSKSTVSFTRSLTSGTKVGSITINGTSTDLYCQAGSGDNITYCTCATAAATAAKVINVPSDTSWTLRVGAMITVKFSNTNTASNPTFNVNGTGAKSVYLNTAVITSSDLGYAGSIGVFLTYMYDGTYWVFVAKSSDNKVTQTATTTNASYEVLFSSTADNATRTEGARKASNLTFNPSTGVLTATNVNAPVYVNQRDGENRVHDISTWRIENRTPSSGKTIDNPAIVRYNKISGDDYSYIAIWPNPVEYPSDDPNNEVYRGWGGRFGLVIKATELDFNGVKLYDSSTGLIPNARLTSASTDTAGIVKLSSSTTSSSTSLAATASAVKSAYDLANGKSTVSFTQSLTSGTQIGTITINSTSTNLYCQDKNVTQTATTTNASYEVLFSSTADNTTRTEGARKASNLKFNPSTGILSVNKIDPITSPITLNSYTTISGSAIQLNSYNSTSVVRLENRTNGTASATGNAYVTIGNSTQTGTAGNAKGYLEIYDSNGYYSYMYTNTLTANRGLYMPNKTGTIATTDDANKVLQTNTTVTTNTFYNVLLSSSEASTSNLTESARKSRSMQFSPGAGTTSTIGKACLTLGNAIRSGIDSNSQGYLRLYSSTTNYIELSAASDIASDYDITFPAFSGQVLLRNFNESFGGGTISSAGWYRVAVVTNVLNLSAIRGASDLSCDIIIKRGFGNTNNEHHEIKLLYLYQSAKFVNEVSFSNSKIITQIRVGFSEESAYIDIYYSGSVGNPVYVILNNTYVGISTTTARWTCQTPVKITDTNTTFYAATSGSTTVYTKKPGSSIAVDDPVYSRYASGQFYRYANVTSKTSTTIVVNGTTFTYSGASETGIARIDAATFTFTE